MSLYPYHTLLASAAEYLRYDQGCYLVTWERGPWEDFGHRPDLLGVDKSRKVTEVEIKRSLADFRNDATKRIWAYRAKGKAVPYKFYYLVPPELVERVFELLPEGSGLMTVTDGTSRGGNHELVVVAPAKTNRQAKPLPLKMLVQMVRHQSGTLVSAVSKLAQLKSSVAEKDEAV